MTKITVINGSPRMTKGSTEFVLSHFLKGLRNAKGDVKVFYPTKMNIQPCLGNLECWGETKEKCIIQDAMQELYPVLKQTEILVLASPVYIPLPSKMQNFLNRLCPLLNPVLTWKNNRTRIQFHEDVKIRKVIGIIIGGWWELENLEIVNHIFQEVANIPSVEFMGAIRRPHAYKLKEDTELNHSIWKVLESLGKQVIEQEHMDPKDLEYVSQPLINEKQYREYLNEVHS